MPERKKKNVRNVSKIDVNGSLISAVTEGNLASVKNLIHSHGLSYCECGTRGYVLLMVAVKLGHNEIAKLLLQEGAKANCETDNVSTPLHLAANQGLVELVQLLLGKNVLVDARNDEYETPLHVAAKEGQADIVDLLLSSKASVTAQTNKGITPLFLAIESRHEKIVQTLLKHACANIKVSVKTRSSTLLNRILLCNPSVCDKVSELVVCIVTNNVGQSVIVDELIDHGFIISREHVDESFLFVAVEKNYIKLIDSILENDHNRSNTKYNPLLLHTAVKIGHKEIAELFLKFGFNASAKDGIGRTCLCYSLDSKKEDKYIDMIRMLLANGANIKEAPELLHIAVIKELIEVCKLLIENGADCNALKYGHTPLHRAVSKKQSSHPPWLKHEDRNHYDKTIGDKIVKLLLNSGADVSINTCSYTAFHHAVLNGRKEAVSIFIECGVDVDLRSGNNSTPLFLASKKGHLEIVEILCQNNADVNVGLGTTSPLRMAVRKQKMEVVKMLLKFGAEINFGINNALNDCDDSDDDDFNGYFFMYTILRNHSVKLEAAGFLVMEQNRGYCESDFWQRCMEEVNRLKKEKLKPGFTLFEVLKNTQNPTYAMNKSLVGTLKSFNLDAFPIYENLIRNSVRGSQFRVELVRSGQKWLDVFIKTSNKLNGWKYSVLPVEILEQIVFYLSNSEIKSLISCGEALRRQLSQQ